MFASIFTTAGNGWDLVLHDLGHWGSVVDATMGPVEVAGLVIACVTMLTWFAFNVTGGSTRDLSAALEPYQVRPNRPQRDGELLGVPALRLVSRLLVSFAERRGFRDVLAERIQRAGLAVGVGEFLTISVVAALVLMALGGLVLGVIGVLAGTGVALTAPLALLAVLAARRARQFAAQIPDVLKLLASSLRAGFSLLQGLDAILYQIKEPMASELRRAFAATRVGAPIEDALEGVAQRVGSRDFAWAVTAIRIQREVGGNLAEILDTVAGTMTERERLRKEVRTLTAEGRLSALIVGALPFGLGGMIFVINRPYITQLFSSFSGQVALLGGFLLEMAGVWWLYRIVQIEI